jgi:hypothetical protein
VIGDLFVIWEDIRQQARQHGHEEGCDMREFLFWLWAWSGIAVGGLLFWKLCELTSMLARGVSALSEIAGKL